ncbi:MAG: hypothetical protein Q9187_001527 [Circinaria calcarea]
MTCTSVPILPRPSEAIEIDFHLLELTIDALGLLRNMIYTDRDAATFEPVQGQAVLEHAVPDQAVANQSVTGQHILHGQVTIPGGPLTRVFIKMVAEELSKPERLPRTIKTPIQQHPVGMITPDKTPPDLLKDNLSEKCSKTSSNELTRANLGPTCETLRQMGHDDSARAPTVKPPLSDVGSSDEDEKAEGYDSPPPNESEPSNTNEEIEDVESPLLSENGSFDDNEDIENNDSCSSSTSTSSPQISYETYKSLAKPQYPIRVSNEGPQPFSIERQQRLIRCIHTLFHGNVILCKIEPNIDRIRLTATPLLERLGMDQSRLIIDFYDQGGYNSVYTIKTFNKVTGEPGEFIFRIPLPIDPYYKIECEVATTEFIRHFTSIPVPVIYAYDSSTNNHLGLEWMLMEKVQGIELNERWTDMDNEDHARITNQVADWADELSRVKSDTIGGIYLRWTNSEMEFFIGPSVEHRFSQDRRLTYSVNRGPFKTVFEYYDALLDVQQQELDDPFYQTALELNQAWKEKELGKLYKEMNVEEQKREDELNRAKYGPQARWSERTQPSLKSLRRIVILYFYGGLLSDVPTILAHEDISHHNLFVDDKDKLVSLLDWECVMFKPLLHIKAYPTFLLSRDREEDFECSGSFGNFQGKPEEWGRLREEFEEIVLTRLRPIHEKRLEDLDSSLCDCFNPEKTFAKVLRDRVWNVVGYDRDMVYWVNRQFEEPSEENVDDDMKVDEPVETDGPVEVDGTVHADSPSELSPMLQDRNGSSEFGVF